MIIDDSGPAFPNAGTSATGMTLRDYFAGQALIGLMTGTVGNDNYDMDNKEYSDEAYAIADAMIEARSGHGRPSGEA